MITVNDVREFMKKADFAEDMSSGFANATNDILRRSSLAPTPRKRDSYEVPKTTRPAKTVLKKDAETDMSTLPKDNVTDAQMRKKRIQSVIDKFNPLKPFFSSRKTGSVAGGVSPAVPAQKTDATYDKNEAAIQKLHKQRTSQGNTSPYLMGAKRWAANVLTRQDRAENEQQRADRAAGKKVGISLEDEYTDYYHGDKKLGELAAAEAAQALERKKNPGVSHESFRGTGHALDPNMQLAGRLQMKLRQREQDQKLRNISNRDEYLAINRNEDAERIDPEYKDKKLIRGARNVYSVGIGGNDTINTPYTGLKAIEDLKTGKTTFKYDQNMRWAMAARANQIGRPDLIAKVMKGKELTPDEAHILALRNTHPSVAAPKVGLLPRLGDSARPGT